jgi:multidrug resistance efflux pump
LKRLLCAALVLALVGCRQVQKLPTPVPVKEGAFTVDVRITASVEAFDYHPMAMPQGLWNGNVEMLLPEGQRVKKGDLIASVRSRDVIDNLLGRQDDLANEQAQLDRLKAAAPVRRWEVQQDIVDRKRALREKTLQQMSVQRGGAEAQVAAARKDVALVDLAIANDPLAVKERLYEIGIIGKQELEQARRDADLEALSKRQAQLALAQLAPGALLEDLDQARLNANMARAAYERATIEAPAKRELVELEQSKNQVRIRGLKKEVHGLQAKVDMAKLYAPTDGMVLYPLIWNWKKVHLGMDVWSGLVFLAVARLDAVKLQGAVSEAEIAKVHVGAKAEITCDGFPGRIFAGSVASVSKLAKEEDSRRGERVSGVKRFDVQVRPNSATPELKPNMRVNVRIISDTLPSASAVPAEALFGDDGARYIWLEAAHGPIKQPVKPKLWGADWVALDVALPKGARVYLVDPTQPIVGDDLAADAARSGGTP